MAAPTVIGLSAGQHHYSPIWYVIVGLLVVAFMATTILRLRRGGPGPAVQWIPRRLRPTVNRTYQREGWQEPYDEDGNKKPRS